jgi:excisionase family DNA binding protein
MKIEENRLRLVTIKEACAYARMGKSRLHELIRDGKIDGRKDGYTTLIDLNSIDDYQAALPKIGPRKAS